ncbi:L,D-transpeptidase family protein [Paenibacillus qinlingensis]|uniref:L,D-transpeptidase family protein n=1 Tax=Paenibacillus qinlingensis TaxID=1837343 RepID=UPI00156573DD|nr:L,D-transpeptidase [Paenibacillus qinlingensis]NQX61549.1 L,D-transpeptidase [Paenibacillus qinlingensis]
MKSKHQNDQLERFFQRNPIEDPLYLKKYVKEHPDHKMGWYLLGKEYTAQGKTGKAAYCFAQAGEIYEAFEQQKIVLEGPLPIAKAAQMEVKNTVNMKRRSSGRWPRLVLLILLLLLTLPTGMDVAKSDTNGSELKVEPTITEGIVSSSGQEDIQALKLYFSEGDWAKKLQEILLPSAKSIGVSVIMEAPKSKDEHWKEWNRSVRPLLSIENSGTSGGESVLKYYQAQICNCQVTDSSSLLPVIASWMHEREEAIIVQSAIQAYQSKTGVLPDKPEQITKPYPDNLLPGLTPQMKEVFPEALQRVKEPAKEKLNQPSTQPPQKEGSAISGTPAPTNPVSQSASSAQSKASALPLTEPLRVIIDTDQHQLAVVSGDYILRRYPVGLGGAKTPQGDFIISEKVRNPNGKSNGEFGSRGMTLSDTLYAIHGTNKPSSIGKDESHGCIRMLQADVEELYNIVPQQTKVTIGKGVLPPAEPGSGIGAGRGIPAQAIGLPLETKDSNPGKRYKWLD